jgi:hypothetical protein
VECMCNLHVEYFIFETAGRWSLVNIGQRPETCDIATALFSTGQVCESYVFTLQRCQNLIFAYNLRSITIGNLGVYRFSKDPEQFFWCLRFGLSKKIDCWHYLYTGIFVIQIARF